MPTLELTKLPFDILNCDVLIFKTNQPLKPGTEASIKLSKKEENVGGWTLFLKHGKIVIADVEIKASEVAYKTAFLSVEIKNVKEDEGMYRVVVKFT